MLFSERSIWTMIHGIVLGRAALMGLFLHRLWRDRHIEPRAICAAALVLTLLGIVGTFPPIWGLLWV